MRTFLKYIFCFVGTLFFAWVVFFFWASSPNLDKSDYQKTIKNSYKGVVNKDSVYSIVTYNIGYLSGMTNNLPVPKPKSLFADNLQKVLTELKALQPDIIAFQEIDFKASRSYEVQQQNEIAKLGYNHVAEVVNWDKTYVPFPNWPPSMHFGSIISGQSVLSKFPIQNHERIVLERVADSPFYREAVYLDRLAQVVTVLIEGKEVVLINVHLEAFDQPTRSRQFDFVLNLFQKYAVTNPTILLGDFNSDAREETAVIHKILQMNSVGNAAFVAENPDNTFNSKNPTKRIDYIFYTKKTIKSLSGKVLTQFGQASDHLPVALQFRLK